MKFPWKVRTIGLLGLDEMIKGETRYGAQNTMPFVYGRARNVRGQEAAFVRVKPHIVCVWNYNLLMLNREAHKCTGSSRQRSTGSQAMVQYKSEKLG